ncbi:hypothetical protein N7492_003646 [Penicillium capsulatum]|uniref:Uncharacterized protein n=1 Tax=Penicillium capsulatum TaxID=69766 RepID=A0A9W9IRI9_9EURO|nr:hypothetical protein N7492_003646 [Penicillium capsulatum]
MSQDPIIAVFIGLRSPFLDLPPRFLRHRASHKCEDPAQVSLAPPDANQPPAILFCDPARFLAELPSPSSAGASVLRQLGGEFYTAETRGSCITYHSGPQDIPELSSVLATEQLCSFWCCPRRIVETACAVVDSTGSNGCRLWGRSGDDQSPHRLLKR